MSQDDLERTRQAFDAANRRDFDAFLALMDPDVEAHPRVVAMVGGFHGHDGIERWWHDMLGFLPDISIDVQSVRDLGDLTLAVLRIRGHGAGSSTPVDETLWSAARWRDGRCVWWANFGTEAEALEAAGLRE